MRYFVHLKDAHSVSLVSGHKMPMNELHYSTINLSKKKRLQTKRHRMTFVTVAHSQIVMWPPYLRIHIDELHLCFTREVPQRITLASKGNPFTTYSLGKAPLVVQESTTEVALNCFVRLPM